MDVEVIDNPDKARFEILADGELAGFVLYHLRGNEIALTHTETDDRFRGHGLASQLVRTTLDQARARHLAVLPYCPFVRSWITEHREYADLVPAGKREQFGL
jgi:predicted GNAT family acetyltransferase